MGGLIVYFDDDAALRRRPARLLEAAARRVSDAVRRVRVTGGPRARTTRPPSRSSRAPVASARSWCSRATRAPAGRGPPLPARPAGRRGRSTRTSSTSAQLCLSELVTNAIMHAGTTSELMVHLEDGVLTVVVRDVGATARPGVPATYLPVPEDDDPLRVFGRGLTLVDAIADRWGSEQDAYGTTAWFALELDRADQPARTG